MRLRLPFMTPTNLPPEVAEALSRGREVLDDEESDEPGRYYDALLRLVETIEAAS